MTWTEFGTVIAVPARGRSLTHGLVPIAHAIKRALDRLVPDHIEVADRLSARQLGQWARTNRVPAVLIVDAAHAAWASERSLNSYDRLVYTSADGFAAAGGTEATPHQAPPPTDPERAFHIPLGVDLETFSPLRHNSPLRDSSGADVVLLCAAPLTIAGSVSLAIDVAKRRADLGDDVHLVVLGDGPLRTRLERNAFGLPVQFLSAQDLTLLERAEVYATADVTLVTDTGTERFAGALESLASGTPVISVGTRTVGQDGIYFVDGGGLNVTRDVTHIAHAIAVIENEPVEKRRRAARATALPYDSLPYDRQMLSLHEALAESTHHG